MTSAALAAGKGRLLPWGIGLLLVIVAILTRWPTFVMSVIDWDESLYVIMAQQWWAGHLPYTAVWDNKPIGIYAIFAAFQGIFGDSIFSMRLAGLLAIMGVALLIWRITRHMLRDHPSGLAEIAGGVAGLLWLGTTIGDDGLAANTEIFTEVFTCLGLLWAVTPGAPIRPGRAIGIGLSLGLAFMVKYVAVFDMFAVYCAMLVLPGRVRRGVPGVADAIRLGLLFSLGALAPLLATLGLYAAYGQLPQMIDASILSNMRRVAVPLSGTTFLRAYREQAALFPALYLSLLWLLGLIARHPARGLILAAWVVTSSLGVASGGLYFSHYFLQLLPALCVTTAMMLASLWQWAPRIARFGIALLFILSLVPMGRAGGAELGRMIAVMREPPEGFGLQRGTPAEVAHDLRAALAEAPGGTVYVFDGEPVLYALLRAPLPTRYVFPSVLLSTLLSHTAGIDPMAELNRILAEKPLFIVRRTNPDDQNAATRNLDVYAAMRAALGRDYTVWRSYGTMVVYRRRS